MNKQLEEIKQALSKATPGPWKREGGTFERGDKRPSVITYFDTDHGEWFIHGDIADKDDAHLIANAPQWLASLVSEVEEMQKIIDTAVMFLQSNELNINAEQIKAMSQSLKGEDKHD